MKISKKDYRHNTSKISVISPESSTFINIDRMVKQVSKVSSESEIVKVSAEHRKYLATKMLTHDQVANFIFQGCLLIFETFEDMPPQFIENNITINHMITMSEALCDEINLGKIEEEAFSYFYYLVRNYIQLCNELKMSVSNENVDVAELLSIYLLITFEYITVSKAA
jgi:hypothetical protein